MPGSQDPPSARRRGGGGSQPDLAVALDYEPEGETAPRVVAKGKGEIAKKIIEIARANGIPVRKDADLAGLLVSVELGNEIPVEAFAAVAEVLAYIYRANGRMPPANPDPGSS